MPLKVKLGLFMSNKILRLTQADHAGAFINRFSVIQKSLYGETNRPISNEHYAGYLINLFESTPKELFIYSENGKDLGRLLVNLTQHSDEMAFFGMVEYQLDRKDIIKDLIEAGVAWAKEKGVKKLIGPVDLNVWFGNRFKTDGSEAEYSWEPTNPNEYVADFLENGFQLDQAYLSHFFDTYRTSCERTKPAYDKALEQGCTFRRIDLDREGEADTLYRLNIAGFCVNYLYEPITQEQYEKTHLAAVRNDDFKFSYFIMNAAGEEMGYVYSFVDSGHHFIKSIVMNPKYQGAGMASALVHRAFKEQYDNGIELKGGGVMVRRGNVSEHFFNHLGTPYKSHFYTMVAREL
jgi:GNAT superfamily N-acetyltransferase